MATQEYHTPPERDVIHLARDDATTARPPVRDLVLAALFAGYAVAAVFMAIAVAFAG